MKKNIQRLNITKKEIKKVRSVGEKVEDLVNKYFNIISIFLIVFVGILVYSNSTNCSFHFDDRITIIENQQITNLSNFTNINYWLHPARQISYLSFALNYHFNKLDVFGYHVINIIVHILTGIFTFLLIKLIVHLNNSKNTKFNKYKNWIALFSALFFMVHPLQTQAVTYIVQRMALMAAMFYIISIYLYAIGRLEHSQKSNTLKALTFYVLALFSGMLGVMTKENAATFPFAMLLFEFFFIRDKEDKICKNYIIFSLSTLVLICVVYLILNPTILLSSASEGINISGIDYLINEFVVIVRYLQLANFPINQCADYGNIIYGFPFIKSFWRLDIIGCCLFLVGLIVLAIFLYKKNKALSFGLFWFFLTLVVESSIIPIADPMFEHRMYLPMLGIGLLLISTLFLILNRLRPIYVFSFLSVIVITLGIACYSRNEIWKNDLTLWTDVVKNASYNARGYYNRGLVRKELGDEEGAKQDYTKAIELKPDYSQAYNNRANIEANFNDNEKAMEDYNRAIELDPKNAFAYKNRGKIKIDKGDKVGSLQDLNRSIELKPDYAEGYNGLGYYFFILKDFKKSISYYEKALEIKPDYSEAFKNLELVKHALENEKNKQ
jgi:protein O-mannosyl-transferase